jgi:Reverse transcriptase (RNA-dependent DNA polymerase)
MDAGFRPNPILRWANVQFAMTVPTVADRVAQMVVKQVIEPAIEAKFLPNSYGYRPGRSALAAVGVTRERCWRYDWVLEFDIKGLFDNIDHALLLRALRKHVSCGWAMLYIRRWLTAPLQLADGTRVERTRGTPQGGVSTPRTQKVTLTTLRVMGATGSCGAAIRRRRQTDGDAMSDDDRVVANEDVLDYEAHDSLALNDIKRVGGAAQTPKKRRERLGKAQERGAISRLVSDRLQLSA